MLLENRDKRLQGNTKKLKRTSVAKAKGDITHICTVSWWVNIESIRAFAGEDYEKARYYDEDRKYLLELNQLFNSMNALGRYDNI